MIQLGMIQLRVGVGHEVELGGEGRWYGWLANGFN
jgi:hypothetical protein